MRFFDFMHLILLNCDIYYTSCIAFCKVIINVSISGLMQSYIRRRSQMKVFLYIRVDCADQLAAANQREELER